MPAATPTTIPSVLTAGETWQWTESISDYPATGGFSLKYALQAPGASLITVTASASGADYAVAVLAATTAGYAPRGYTVTAYVELGAVRYPVVFRRSLSLLASPLAAFGSTHASRMLTLIEAALEGRIPNGLEMTNVDGQELHLIAFDKLSELHDKYLAKVQLEIAKSRPGRSNTIGIRFVNPR